VKYKIELNKTHKQETHQLRRGSNQGSHSMISSKARVYMKKKHFLPKKNRNAVLQNDILVLLHELI